MKATADDTSAREERRQYPRKKVSLPAFVVVAESASVHPVTIQDVSPRGVKIVAPKDSGLETGHFHSLAPLTLLIPLPQEISPLATECRSCRLQNRDDAVEVGAVFTHPDYVSSDKLQQFLFQ